MAVNLDMDVDCLTFLQTVDSQKLDNGDTLWTPVFKFDPPTDYRVRGKVTLIKEQWKIQLIPLPIQNIDQLACPVKFTWTLSVVKDRKSLLQDSRDISWEKIKRVINNTHNEYDVIDSIQVSHNDLKTGKMTGADGSVSFMWFVKLFLDHSQTSHETKEKETGNEQIVTGEPRANKHGFKSIPQMSDSVYNIELKETVSTPECEEECGARLHENRIDNASNKQKRENIVEDIEKLNLQQGKEQTKQVDAEKDKMKEESLTISGAYEVKMKDNMYTSMSQTIEKTENEEAQKWQDREKEIARLNSLCQSLEAQNNALTEKLERLQRTTQTQKTPKKVRLKCRDLKGRTVTVTIPKTSPIKPLISEYCKTTGYKYHQLIFFFDGLPLSPYKTPHDNNLEDDDMIDVIKVPVIKVQGREKMGKKD